MSVDFVFNIEVGLDNIEINEFLHRLLDFIGFIMNFLILGVLTRIVLLKFNNPLHLPLEILVLCLVLLLELFLLSLQVVLEHEKLFVQFLDLIEEVFLL